MSAQHPPVSKQVILLRQIAGGKTKFWRSEYSTLSEFVEAITILEESRFVGLIEDCKTHRDHDHGLKGANEIDFVSAFGLTEKGKLFLASHP